MANSVDPDETAHYEPSHLDLHCLHRYWFWSAGLKWFNTSFQGLDNGSRKIVDNTAVYEKKLQQMSRKRYCTITEHSLLYFRYISESRFLLYTEEVNLQTFVFITKTCLYNFDSLKPHFYIVKLGFTGGKTLFFIFLLKTQIVSTR